MADLLTHVLAGYIVGAVLSLRYERIGPMHVTIVMIGAFSPDIKKIDLWISDSMMTEVLGVPWGWSGLHTLGGSVAVILVGAVLVGPGHRKLVIKLLATGAATHHLLDLLLISVSGQAYPVLWPLTEYRPPAGGLYISSDRIPLIVFGCVATILWAIRRRRAQSRSVR